jgi:16S rRNA (guanine527-N7)-methyltransferase
MNNEQMENKMVDAIMLSAEVGAPLTTNAIANLEFLVTLIEEWNTRSGLTAANELPHLWENHIFDSLSLMPYLLSATQSAPLWLDIGCGGGFPLIPCKTVLSSLPVIALERTQKKVAYLHFAIAQLQLEHVNLIHGAFPESMPKESNVGAITARAVEKPELWAKSLVPLIEGGATFLCQQPEIPKILSEKFHVEQIEDKWTEKELRRGELHLIKA